MKKGLILFAVALVLGLWITSGGQQKSRLEDFKLAFSQDASSQAPQNLGFDMNFGRMPVYFIANEGQVDEQVAYYIKGKDKQIYFTQNGVTFVLSGRNESEEKALQRWIVKLEFTGADKNVSPKGEDETGAVISYFKGRPEEWRTGIVTYARVVYANLWPGIDLVYRGAEGRLKYAFVVHPGADPGMIRMVYRGASQVTVTDEGELEIKTPLGGFADGRPNAYQEEDGKRVDVGIEYDLYDGEENQYTYGFRVGEYDRSRQLILDPAVLIYCGYIGGTGSDSGRGIAVDSSGNAYVTGWTYSDETSFPITLGPDLIHNSDEDAFIAKVKADGTGFLYCGYIGGTSVDYGNSIAVDGSGSAYVTGYTQSTQASFPVTVGPDLTHNGAGDAFVAKVEADGTDLVYCGFIGGAGSDNSKSITVDSSGSAYITGPTHSTQAQNFPVKVGPDLTHNGGLDAYVVKVNSSGTGLVYCGYIGGTQNDAGNGIAVDGSGNAYIAGDADSTQAQNFPVTVGPDLTHNGGVSDVFVAKVNSTGSDLVYCGYIGGSNYDFSYRIALDSYSNAYITGETSSKEIHNFPVTVGPDLTHNGGFDAYVVKVNSSGTGLVYCGYIGGTQNDEGRDIAVDSSGNAYITGNTESTQAQNFPVTVGPDLTHNGGSDAFVAKIKANGTGLIYCGYIGGTQWDYSYGLAVDRSGSAYIIGETPSSQAQNFPVKVGPDLTYNSGSDAFVAKIHHYIAKNDFNSDGQGDILWRHYGTGKNALWYIGSGGSLALSQGKVEALSLDQGPSQSQVYQSVIEAGEILYQDERVYHSVLDVDVPCEKAEGNVYGDIFKAGEGRTAGDAQELMNPGNLKAGVQAISVIGAVYLTTITDVYWGIGGSGDFNDDGDVDILWRHYVSGENAVWYMDGGMILGTAYLIKITDVNWQMAGTGDFNGDGSVDILWRHYGTGENAVWYMNGSTIMGLAYLTKIADTNWRIGGTGDFNGDGKVDILWRHLGTGGNALWYMNGSAIMGSAYLFTVTDTNWRIEGTGEFNGDGKADILWRNYSHGANAVWYMNGSAIIGTEYLTTIADVNWRIENH